MVHGVKYRIYPDDAQIGLIARTFGCVRYLYNHYLWARSFLHDNGYDGVWTKYNSYHDIVYLKNGIAPWLREVDAIALQTSVDDLNQAFENFFRGCRTGENIGYPRFKSKRDSRQSYRTKLNGKNIEVGEKAVKLPKLGWVKAKISKKIVGKIKTATVSRNPAGKYFVSICYDDETIQKLPSTGRKTGIDLGKKDLAIFSDGTTVDNRRCFAKLEAELAKAQRELSRKQKDSRRREKAKLKVARIHEKIRNMRLDWIHKVTTDIVRNYDYICIEDLDVKGLMKGPGAKGTADAAWGKIRRQLEYKCEWYGKTLVVAGRYFASSQICHCCGEPNPAVKDLKVREWVCPFCGVKHDRDINAAINLEMYMDAELAGVPIEYEVKLSA